MQDLDTILMILQNATRRRILRRLTIESHYPLQLAKQLKLSTQAISKHLELLEKHGLVECQRIHSNRGPKRKCYYAVTGFSLRLGVGPNLFDAKVSDLLEPGEKMDTSREELETEGSRTSLLDIKSSLKTLNKQISSMDEEMSQLLKEKEEHMARANQLIKDLFDRYEEREILHYILAHEDYSLPEMSRSLGLREEEIRIVLNRLTKMNLLEEEE